ncbi:hypothetical protein R3P38DRAFT_2758985 [Favolaschia claudopus]|uniref:Uncharacterized protein n=1 Tax=Favolaschia claudopus TaxID=2862362 RepID=A0AAW0E6F8_9AGAR
MANSAAMPQQRGFTEDTCLWEISQVTKYRPRRLLSAVTFSLPLLLSTLSALVHSYVRTTVECIGVWKLSSLSSSSSVLRPGFNFWRKFKATHEGSINVFGSSLAGLPDNSISDALRVAAGDAAWTRGREGCGNCDREMALPEHRRDEETMRVEEPCGRGAHGCETAPPAKMCGVLYYAQSWRVEGGLLRY